MPVEKRRQYTGKPDALGSSGPWHCPGCGTQNEGKIERGCVHCGAGDPTKSKAGSGTEPVAQAKPGMEATIQHPRERTEVARPIMSGPRVETSVPPMTKELQTVYRLIEYVGTADWIHTTLQRSLVGSLSPERGRITATIVDSLSGRQEDLLGLARQQPGVWVSNPTLMGMAETARPESNLITSEPPFHQFLRQREAAVMAEPLAPPATGPEFSPTQDAMAQSIIALGGYRLAYTLALALQAVLPELEAGGMEAEKFLPAVECLQLANALMQRVPAEWQGEIRELETAQPPADPEA